MVLEALRSYAQIAGGLTEVSRQRAVAAARSLLEQGMGGDAGTGPMGRQAQALGEELLATGRANRDLLLGIVRAEVDRAVHGLGLVRREELTRLQTRIAGLERQLRSMPDSGAAAGTPKRPRARTVKGSETASSAARQSRRTTKKPARTVKGAQTTTTRATARASRSRDKA